VQVNFVVKTTKFLNNFKNLCQPKLQPHRRLLDQNGNRASINVSKPQIDFYGIFNIYLIMHPHI